MKEERTQRHNLNRHSQNTPTGTNNSRGKDYSPGKESKNFSQADPNLPTGTNTTMDIDHEVSLLVDCLKRIGEAQPDGSYKTTFGKIFKDEVLEQQLESLVGTMKAAKKKGVIDFQGQMLLQGAHDNVEVTLKA